MFGDRANGLAYFKYGKYYSEYPSLIFAEVNQTIHVASLALHANKRHISKFNDKQSSLLQNIGQC